MTHRQRPSETQPAAEDGTHSGPQEPAWVLAQGCEPLTREELLARYRRQRALPEDPFEAGGRPKPPPGYRDMIMSQPNTATFLRREMVAPEPAPPPAPRRGLSFAQTFALAAAMGLAAGAGVGLSNLRLSWGPDAPSPPMMPAEAVAAVTPDVLEPTPRTDPAPALRQAAMPQVPARSTEITKKSVPTATLEVADAAGETNSFIPLALRAEPANLGSDILLKISGVPDGAFLTSGKREEDQIWALTREDLKNLRLVVPEAKEREIDLAVAAFEPRTGELAAPVKTMTVALSNVVVEPASAPPPRQMPAAAPKTAKTALPDASESGYPAPIPPPESVSLSLAKPETPETRKLLAEGNSLFKYGDIRKARNAYEKAWKSGSAAGAYNLARSYDPVILASLNLKKAAPDKAKALEWYERAATAGHEEAAAAIVRLRLKR